MFSNYKINPVEDLDRATNNVSDLPSLPIDYFPNVIEIFDQYGLLAGVVVSKGIPYEMPRHKDQVSDYNAWYFDGQLCVFYRGKNILLDRTQNLQHRAAIFGALGLGALGV
ncbi:hypothetical protein BJP36_04680 [Moorena producens JHB]|uniref:Uncharacterized protein n=1 Tax=Moorena producens (strain JHB) TaxID=1454205 RepID=A0A1D9FVL2_MOOP1|nr:hypothetical protein [Moorena producens]AOY79314.1 hypothetical protein BJP36_04680 [Moorena producens JHB]